MNPNGKNNEQSGSFISKLKSALSKSEQRFKDAAQNPFVWFWEVDDEGRFTYVSPLLEDFLGFTVSEMLLKHFWEIAFPEDQEKLRQSINDINSIRKAFKGLVNRCQHKNGEAVWFLSSGVPIFDPHDVFRGYRGMDVNITEQKLSEQRLAEAQRIAHIGNWEWNLLTNELYWSDEIYQIFGINRQDFEADFEAFIESVHPEDREFVKANVNKALYNKLEYNIIHRIVLPDDSEKTVREQARVIFNNQDRPIRMIGTIQDISEYTKAEDALHKTEEQLRQSQKLEAIGRLAGGIAHDFNNLMTVIIGYSELILGKMTNTSDHYSELEEIMKAGKRASQLTRQLLAFSRRQVLKPKITNLNKIIIDIDKMLCRVIGEDIELISALQPELSHVKVDQSQIVQVIMNLVINAKDAMLEGGKLTIKTSEQMLDEEYVKHHADAKSGMHVMLSVADTGVGMDNKTRSKIFEPFFTTKEMGKGTGLGLSTVYGIVKQSGGNIWVYSGPGEGTIFKIYFPKADGETEHTRCSTTFLKGLQGNETILLVEDDESVRKVAKRMLLLKGYTVKEAMNPEEALNICKKVKVHVLLTDVVMPNISGAELAKQIQGEQPGIKVLFMSGYTDEAIAHHGVLEEGTHFLEKPFTARDLAIKIIETLSEENTNPQ